MKFFNTLMALIVASMLAPPTQAEDQAKPDAAASDNTPVAITIKNRNGDAITATGTNARDVLPARSRAHSFRRI